MRLLLVRVNKGRIPSFHRVVPRCHTGTTFLLSGKPSWSSTGVLCCRVLSDCDMCGLLENTGSGSRFGYQNYITWVPGKVSKMGEVGPTFIVKNTDLGTLGGTSSQAFSINNAGDVAGFSDISPTESHAFLWTRKTGMIDLGNLGGQSGIALGINDKDQVVGVSFTSSGQLHAFLWSNGQMNDLVTLGGTVSRAFAINNQGQIIGTSQTASGSCHAFLYQNGTMTDFGSNDGAETDAYGINEKGQIVGIKGVASNPEFLPIVWTTTPLN